MQMKTTNYLILLEKGGGGHNLGFSINIQFSSDSISLVSANLQWHLCFQCFMICNKISVAANLLIHPRIRNRWKMRVEMDQSFVILWLLQKCRNLSLRSLKISLKTFAQWRKVIQMNFLPVQFPHVYSIYWTSMSVTIPKWKDLINLDCSVEKNDISSSWKLILYPCSVVRNFPQY